MHWRPKMGDFVIVACSIVAYTAVGSVVAGLVGYDPDDDWLGRRGQYAAVAFIWPLVVACVAVWWLFVKPVSWVAAKFDRG